jgi:alpha-L-fucosidase 2
MKILTVVALAILAAGAAAVAQPSPLTLWYDKPAELWTDALPVGNGRMGAMVLAA